MSNQKTNVVGIEKFIIYPINKQSTYSFKNGNPNISFQFQPSSTRMLNPQQLRFNFTLNVKQPNGKRVNNEDSNGYGAYDAKLNERVGVNAIIDVLRLRNLKNETIEEVRNYSRLLASLIPAQTNFASYKNWASNKFVATANVNSQNCLTNGAMECSLPLRAGIIMSGRPLNLGDLGGMKVDIQLQNDQFVIFGTNASTGAYYEISDVSLSGNYFVLDRPSPPSSSQLVYPAFNSFLTIVNSGDDQQSLNLSLNSVRQIFSNSIPSSHLNNYNFDCLATPRLRNTNDDGDTYNADAKVKEYTFLRGAVKYPKQYSTDERDAVNNNVSRVHKERDFLDSIKSFRNLQHSLVSPVTEGSLTADSVDAPTANPITGLGVRLDGLSVGAGADYSTQQFTQRIVSELDGKSPNTLFTFTLSNQALKTARSGDIVAVQ